MKSKKIFPLVLAVMAILSLAACGTTGTPSASPDAVQSPDVTSAAPDPSQEVPPVVSEDTFVLTVGETFPLSYDSPELFFYPEQPVDITPMNRDDIASVIKELDMDGAHAFYFHKPGDKAVYLGITIADTSYQLLVATDELVSGTEWSYVLDSFRQVLGRDGFKAVFRVGTTLDSSVYFTIEDGIPRLLAYAFNATEADVDGDGDGEIVCDARYADVLYGSVLFKRINGEVRWTEPLSLVLSPEAAELHMTVTFDKESHQFTAVRFTADEEKITNTLAIEGDVLVVVS